MVLSWSWNKRTIYVAKTAKSNSEEHVLEQKVCTTSLGTSRWKLQKENLKIHTLYFLNLKSTQSEFTLSYQLDYSSVSLGNRKVFCINSCKSIVYSNATYWHSKFYKKKKNDYSICFGRWGKNCEVRFLSNFEYLQVLFKRTYWRKYVTKFLSI